MTHETTLLKSLFCVTPNKIQQEKALNSLWTLVFYKKMAISPNVVYRALEKGEWKPEVLADAVAKRAAFQKLKPSSKKDLDAIAKDYTGSFITQINDPKALSQAIKAYDSYLGKGTEEYALGNLKGMVKYVGQENVVPITLNLPAQKGRGSKEDYDGVASLVEKLQGFEDETKKDAKSIERILDKTFEKQDKFSKLFWIGALGGIKGALDFERDTRARKAAEAIVKYGVVDYMKDALKISDAAEKAYGEESKALQEKADAEVKDLTRKLGVTPTPSQLGEINDKYTSLQEKIEDKYGDLRGARKLILEGSKEAKLPGVINLAIAQYQADEKKKKAEEEKAKALAKAA